MEEKKVEEFPRLKILHIINFSLQSLDDFPTLCEASEREFFNEFSAFLISSIHTLAH